MVITSPGLVSLCGHSDGPDRRDAVIDVTRRGPAHGGPALVPAPERAERHVEK